MPRTSQYFQTNTLKILKHFFIRESNDLQTITLQKRLTLLIFLQPARVTFAINLDDQFHVSAIEIDNERADGLLAAELHSRQTTISQQAPEDSFRDGRIVAQLAAE